LIRHFNIFPIGFNKDDLFPEQKVFLMYLCGVIPTMENWNTMVKYHIDRKIIETSVTIADIELSDEEVDTLKLQGRNIDEVKKERIPTEKKKRIEELNERYGVVSEEENNGDEKTKKSINPNFKDNPLRIWEMLQGKGLLD
jgi:hypothetical protein